MSDSTEIPDLPGFSPLERATYIAAFERLYRINWDAFLLECCAEAGFYVEKGSPHELELLNGVFQRELAKRETQ